MNRIRSFHRLANSGFSSPFQLIRTSNGRLKLVQFETPNLVHGLNAQCCGRSYSTSASLSAVEVKRTQRRVSKLERKSMVESYVNRYREMNAGKYPTVTDVRKNVGGSYYSVRKYLQELIYCSDVLLTEPKDSVSLVKRSVKKDELCTRSGDVIGRKRLEHIAPIPKVNVRDDSSKSLESKEGLQSPTLDQTDVSKLDGPQSHHPVDEPKSSLQPDPENIVKHETVREDKLNLDTLQPKSEPEQSIESHVPERESHKLAIEDAEPQQKSSVWQNLRSFATGILGIWKRS